MRNIDSSALAALATNLGTEPTLLLEIDWAGTGTRTLYSDVDINIGTYKPKIVEISGLDNVMDLTYGSQSAELSVTLDDTDGSILAILNQYDVHKRKCWVYQWFKGLAITDKFLIFEGELNSPLEWHEGDRTFKLTVITQIEHNEIGFSIEEGDFLAPPPELINKAWPLCFGTVVNVPALQLIPIWDGTLGVGTGIHDFTLANRISSAKNLLCPLTQTGVRTVGVQPGHSGPYCTSVGVNGFPALIDVPVFTIDQSCSQGICTTVETLSSQLAEQLAYEVNPVVIFNGYLLPQQTTMTLSIGNGKFTGHFTGTTASPNDTFFITDRQHPKEGSAYICKIANTGVPLSNTSDWELIVPKEIVFSANPQSVNQTVYGNGQGQSYFGNGTITANTATDAALEKTILTQDGYVIVSNISDGSIASRIHWRGEWSPTLPYAVNDGVYINAHTGNLIASATDITIESTCGTIGFPTPPKLIQDPCSVQADISNTLAQSAWASQVSFLAFNALKSAGFFWAAAGSKVRIHSISPSSLNPTGTIYGSEIIYVANLLPSTILSVSAYRNLNGARALQTVPSNYYTVRETNYTGYTGVTEIVFQQPLSTMDTNPDGSGGGWSDEIYVTLTSSVGPNTVDILEWLISTYTQYTVDSTSFNAVRAKLANYPMNFPILQRKDIGQVLKDISYQARCGLWLADGVFFIKYLSETPTAVDTITQDDILVDSLKLSHTGTENIVTKYITQWRYDYSLPEPNYVVLRANVKKYGTQEQTYDYYTYNIVTEVSKSATYWMIRNSNTWRELDFQTPLHKLNLEVFDAVTLNIPTLFPAPVIGIIMKASYSAKDNAIDFHVWTPCLSGTTVAYNFAFPSSVSETDVYPPRQDVVLGLAGSGTLPNFVTIAPPGHVLSNTNQNHLVKIKLPCDMVPFGDDQNDINYVDNWDDTGDTVAGSCRGDFGTKKPSDAGDVKPDVPVSTDIGVNTGPATSPIASEDSQKAATAFFNSTQGQNMAAAARTEAAKNQPASGNSDNSGQSPAQQQINKLPDSGCGNPAGPFPCNMYTADFALVKVTATTPPDYGFAFGFDQIGSQCMTFDSLDALHQAATNLQNYFNTHSFSPGDVTLTGDRAAGDHPDIPNFPVNTDPTTGLPCPVPGNKLIGYHNNTPGNNPGGANGPFGTDNFDPSQPPSASNKDQGGMSVNGLTHA